MRSKELKVNIEGELLHRLELLPEKNTEIKGLVLCYHGQGDYAQRYLDIMHPFTRRGYICVITELPGHGSSPGKRGHCGTEAFLDAVIQNTLETYPRSQGYPYGIMGHSMGGLLAIRHLILAGLGELPVPKFAWISSPLLKPSRGRGEQFLSWVRIGAKIFPSFTISTKVNPDLCRVKADDEVPVMPAKHQLWHSRISIGWGTELIKFEKLIEASLKCLPDVPILLTQGAEDTVCPPEYARDFFSQITSDKKQYCELAGMLHEPFKGVGSEELFSQLEIWLDKVDHDSDSSTSSS
ncbi:MAG: alpha/beta fold hydrolase [Akkermansiaceae bacterium]